ncbi:MAG: hemerythrin family protein [Deltaproteobacteria bacterium]|nr:hemerythrin family protein [Deltaproteobacteria bacterium]
MSSGSSPWLASKTLAWRPELVLGFDQMDMQHQHLVACAGELQLLISANGPRQEVAKSIAALIAFSRQHFDWEERLMRANGYGGYTTHKAQHDHLLDQLLQVEHELSAGLVNSCQTLSLFVETWTVQHLLIADRLLADFLKDLA